MISANLEEVPEVQYSNLELRQVTKIRKNRNNKRIEKDKEQKQIDKRKRNFIKKLQFFNILITCIFPAIALILSDLCLGFIPLTIQTFQLSFLYYVISGISVTAGYHRCFCHRSYETVLPIRIVYAVFGAGTGVGSIKYWCSMHRAHHRYTDTEKDPHSIKRGFFFSHIGWYLIKPHMKLKVILDEYNKSEDITNDDVIEWQAENYYALFILSTFLIPAFISATWGDIKGGILYAGLIRMFFIQQTTFNINSFCHSVGHQIFDDKKSPKSFFLWNFLTFGEGNHNFHHEFPSDYRNGIKWYDFDPSKWFISVLHFFKLAKNLQKADEISIIKLVLQQKQKILDKKRAQLNWGIPIDKLPTISPQEFTRLARNSAPQRALVAVSGIVHDVTPFIYDHPGGVALVKASIGKDATSVFNGAVYDHSHAARNLLATMRIAILSGGSEEMVWKQQQIENKEIPLKNDSSGTKIVRSGEQATMVKTFSTTAGAA